MKLKRILPILIMILSLLFSFNVFAMKNKYSDFIRQTPLNEEKNGDKSLDFKWTWISDESCVRFKIDENVRKATLERQYNSGLLPQWAEDGKDGRGVVKTRDTYSGKWSQSADGIWSFEFNDKTFPVGVTKIDGVLYAFTGYGELKDGYEYYDGLKTGADGLVKSDNPDFLDWLMIQYLPECISHE